MSETDNARPWKSFLIAALIMGMLAIYPQLALWISKGTTWRGSYVVSNYDETAYSAYVNSLVSGEPRKNDPFIGSDDTGHESLYSVQFIPPYLIAIPARLFGISTSTAFIGLAFLSAAASCFALCWFIFAVTGQSLLSAAGALAVLCLGTAAALQGELCRLAGGSVLIDFFPFMRRYQPGIAFPLFFVFTLLTWRSFATKDRRRMFLSAVGAGCAFAVLVFSYFYLWTAAAAWALCVFVTGFIFLKEMRSRILLSSSIIGMISAVALVPYWIMLSGRSPDLDRVQLLANTHRPDIFSPPLIIGLLILIGIGYLAYRGIDIKRKEVLLAITFAATPIVLFNQQVITGRSLQPVHYQVFIANYLVLVALVLIASIWTGDDRFKASGVKKILRYAAAGAVVWGIAEAAGSASFNSTASEIRDESVPAIQAIEKIRSSDPASGQRPVVLATNFITSDIIPTFSTFRPLWNAHTSSAGGVSPEENKRLFYLFLYYSGYSEKDLGDALTKNSFEVTAAIFGSERALPALGSGAAIRPAEIQNEVRMYADFSRNFNPNDAANPTIDYLIVPDKAEPDHSNLDRWYQRDEGRTTGLFKVYKLTRRS